MTHKFVFYKGLHWLTNCFVRAVHCLVLPAGAHARESKRRTGMGLARGHKLSGEAAVVALLAEEGQEGQEGQ